MFEYPLRSTGGLVIGVDPRPARAVVAAAVEERCRTASAGAGMGDGRVAKDWRDSCREKLTTAGRAISHIRPGDRIFIGSGSAVPAGLIPHLVDPRSGLGDNEIVHLLTLGEAPYAEPRFEGIFRHNALFIGPNVRTAVMEGRADYTPVFLSEIPGLIRRRLIAIDVAILSVTPPDEAGQFCLGTHVDVAPAALDAARLVIAEVNPRLPRTCGRTTVGAEQIDFLVECEHAVPELVPPTPRPETEAIASNVARLIMDGATLQVGIGGIPNAVLRALAGHHDLGLHTEMFSDGVIDLVEQGVMTGARKSLNPGKLIASFVMGTRRLYDFVRENPRVELHPIEYVNDPLVIARNDCLAAINTALEIDLTGQVCSDSMGDRFYSGIGGQVDFIRGAARSRGGKPIIALPSTAADGEVSRIVPQLSHGAGVVTTRGDVHFVVTEYGIAYLHGKTVRQRAIELIQIAHPKFRPWLLAQAKHRRLVYRDQVEPEVRTSAYPAKYEFNLVTRDGMPFRLRPIKPTDEAMLHEMFYRFSRETVYQRFFAVRRFFEHRDLQRFCTIDYERDMTLVATIRDDVVTRVVGMALYVRDPKTGFGDCAFVVADEYQNRGIGTEMILRLTDIARESGLRGYTANVLATNVRMLRLFEKPGFDVATRSEGETLGITITFPAQDGASANAG
jgi:acyl-CoA hydrolase/RimJ/RimL family protein N-acetyltransferase